MQPSACLMCLCSYRHVSYACAAISFYLAQWTNTTPNVPPVSYNYRHASSVCPALAAYVHAVIVRQSNQWYSSDNGMFLVPPHDM